MNSFTGNFQQRFKPAPMLPHVLTQAPLPPHQTLKSPLHVLNTRGKHCTYVLVCHPYVTRLFSCLIRISLLCTRMSSICYSYVLACHPYVTRMYSYVIRMSLVCGFTMNRFWHLLHFEQNVPVVWLLLKQ